jgi:hypothetical protein
LYLNEGTLILLPDYSFLSLSWKNYDNNVTKLPINAAVWAVRFGYDNRGWNNFNDAKEVCLF